mmetsp:Transcript_12305/g.30135  ORF Transcript_12305/g.30135 Transcript_12305/m.30135 type:complete len:221 (+) Transcript_12305:314-976(+)
MTNCSSLLAPRCSLPLAECRRPQELVLKGDCLLGDACDGSLPLVRPTARHARVDAALHALVAPDLNDLVERSTVAVEKRDKSACPALIVVQLVREALAVEFQEVRHAIVTKLQLVCAQLVSHRPPRLAVLLWTLKAQRPWEPSRLQKVGGLDVDCALLREHVRTSGLEVAQPPVVCGSALARRVSGVIVVEVVQVVHAVEGAANLCGEEGEPVRVVGVED